MSDQYEQVRSLSFPALAAALGLDISDYKQRKHGQEFYGPCPVHNPKQNSTSFSYAADGRFNCFSCNAKGRGAIDLFKLVKNVGFQAAVELLGAVPIVEPSKQKGPATGINESVGEIKPFKLGNYEKHYQPCEWLETRIADKTVRDRYGVGLYANPTRKSLYTGKVMLPIRRFEDGEKVGYLARSLETHQSTHSSESVPKYLFPRGFEKHLHLYGAWELKTSLSLPLKVVYLVESPFCCLKYAMYGLPAISPFGWSVSSEQIELLTKLAKGILYLPDRNKAQACDACIVAMTRRLWVRCPPLPDGIDDPEYLTKEQVLAL